MDKTILFKKFCSIVDKLPEISRDNLQEEITQIKNHLRNASNPKPRQIYALCWSLHNVHFHGTLFEISEELESVGINIAPDTLYNSISRHGAYKSTKSGGFTVRPAKDLENE